MIFSLIIFQQFFKLMPVSSCFKLIYFCDFYITGLQDIYFSKFIFFGKVCVGIVFYFII